MKLYWIGLKANWFELTEFFRVLWRFRSSRKFVQSYLLLKLGYFLDSPYQVSKRYLQRRDERDLYQYGETPVSAFASIVTEAGIDPDDHIYELGAGAGYCSLWLAAYADFRVTAVEQVPVFCKRLDRVSRKAGLEKLSVSENDYLKENLEKAGLIYLYASNLEDSLISALAARLSELPVGAKIISVSYALADYVQKPGFEVVKVWPVSFPWGKANVFLQVRTADRRMSVG